MSAKAARESTSSPTATAPPQYSDLTDNTAARESTSSSTATAPPQYSDLTDKHEVTEKRFENQEKVE